MKNIEFLTVEKVEDSLDAITDVTNQLANALKRETERKDVSFVMMNQAISEIPQFKNQVFRYLKSFRAVQFFYLDAGR